jgi:hypothetical protein
MSKCVVTRVVTRVVTPGGDLLKRVNVSLHPAVELKTDRR